MRGGRVAQMIMGVSMGRRAKIYLTPRQLHALLGLPDDVRVVAVLRDDDPVRSAVVLEGDSLPGAPPFPGGPPETEMAYFGLTEAPPMWHPIHGWDDTMPSVRWGAWRPGVPGSEAALDDAINNGAGGRQSLADLSKGV